MNKLPEILLDETLDIICPVDNPELVEQAQAEIENLPEYIALRIRK